MRLRIPGFGKRGSSGPAKSAKSKTQRADDARDKALKGMKGRVEDARPAPDSATVVPAELAPAPEPAAPPEIGAGEPNTPPSGTNAADPLGGIGDDTDPLKGMADIANDSGDSDLLGLFMEAKVEAEGASLASELEDVHISDLLGEVLQIGNRLGVNTAAVQQRKEPAIAPAVEPAAAGPTAFAEPPEIEPHLPEPVPATLDPAQAEYNAPAAAPEDVDITAILPAVHVVAIPPEEDAPALEPEPDSEPLPVVRRVDPAEVPVIKTASGTDLHGVNLIVIGVVGIGLALTTSLGISLAKEENSAPEEASVLSMVTFPRVEAVGTASIVDPEPVTPQVGESAFMRPSTPEALPEPSPGSPQVEVAVSSAERPPYFTYTVEAGDSLTSIAVQFGICPDHIIWNNSSRLADDTLDAGSELILPGYPGLIHAVRGGDTVQRLADEFNTTPSAIIAYSGNNLKSAKDLHPGDTILLPGGFPMSVLEKSREERIAYTNPSASGYVWPFYGPITTFYGEQRPGYVHTAIDIGGLDKWGAPVIAIAAGRVVAAIHDHPGLGNYVVVAHNDGSRSLYAHLANTSVNQGDSVPIGARLGSLGCTGYSTGTHLHFELWRDGHSVDPLQYLASPEDA